jgi:Flp pilus assembly pilin Flp
MKKILREFLKDERGQSTTEYILILSVVVMVALKFREKFNGTMGKMMQKLDTDMMKGLEE